MGESSNLGEQFDIFIRDLQEGKQIWEREYIIFKRRRTKMGERSSKQIHLHKKGTNMGEI